LLIIILVVVFSMRSIGTPCLTHLKVHKLFDVEGAVGVNKLGLSLFKLL
jgi:hypothetical protein